MTESELRERFPYCMDMNEVTSEAFCINREYEYIDLDTKVLSSIRENSADFNRSYTYDDSCKPWLSKANKKKAMNELAKLCCNKNVVNENEFIY